ncbi:MAG: class I SAM-dependent methyltransferase [Rhodoferax sp.]|jgi:2-polyprenyl-3-methyl-5-hydroxy-6-metoxy-1,4-benzoquinol methylase|nr:class I SAM-dependent methyltransferase [Rhodoferax sp.]
MQSYSTKSGDYFAHARREIEPLLPHECGRVLEIGCGSGATLGWLKQKYQGLQAVGLEMVSDAANVAAQYADSVHCMDIESQPSPHALGHFDLIICLDVLEHLVDPWVVIDRFVKDHLVDGGILILSLPNVRHFSVVLPLLTQGRWDYADDGVLDRTHLRFFTRRSALKLAESLGSVDAVHATGLEKWRKTWWLNFTTLSIFKSFFEYQYLIRVTKAMS